MPSTYEQAGNLFTGYPMATNPGSQKTMTLAVTSGPQPRFYTLRHVANGNPLPFYSLCIHGTHDGVAIQADGTAKERPVPDAITLSEAARILGDALPEPRDGSLFGWVHGRAVTALIAFYDDGTPGGEPSWAPMPRSGAAESQWPPFVGEHLLGPWFWQHHQAGRIVNVGDQIAGKRGQVYWADTVATLGHGLTVAASDIRLAGGITLPRGMYVYHQSLRDGVRLPGIDEVLSGTGLLDLGPRFRDAA